jgi:enoyl-CoA hydratase/carnithine racemase
MCGDDLEPWLKAGMTSDADVPVRTERRGAALWLWLNWPHALNSLTPQMMRGLHEGLDLAEEPDVRVVVIAGEGRAFSAGADLTQVLTQVGDDTGPGAENDFLGQVGAAFDRLESFGNPVIAAVHGLAVAGGLELVLCCDLVVATTSASFGDAHANYGLLPAGGGSIRLPRRVGPARAKHLMFTGVTLPARDLAGTDLITTLVDDGQLASAVDSLVAGIAGTSPAGIASMKALIDDGLQVPREVGLRMERQRAAAHSRTHDFHEGVSAFTEKRSPKFTGR